MQTRLKLFSGENVLLHFTFMARNEKLTLTTNMAGTSRVWSQNFQTATHVCDEIWALALRYDPNFKDVLSLIKKNAR